MRRLALSTLFSVSTLSLLYLVAVPAQANPVIASEEAQVPTLFDRLQLRLGGIAMQPADDLDGIGYQLGLSGYWMLSPWAVLELGGAYQGERFSYDSSDDYDVTSYWGHYGGRLLWPPAEPVYLSVAARWHRGRLTVHDAGSAYENMRLAYEWYEGGLHLNPSSFGAEVGVSLRYYDWANDDREWSVVAEWLLPGRDWLVGIDGETTMNQNRVHVGLSVNRRF
ncbi:hypothetical protein E4656_16610 [Natronospirillum operosum]|uniref:Outer membrane protein beta-barrel domain-containing protein n=1 Tax=Natronospirillum operosum TaxID=2759953 RepID=A0A4Z0W790_9GAMM|nr:hypothetical protein [Natronospirillum operosum]TGG91340.1 hypothetical protein E4656_16610 [Natronospirillum operosum]